MLKVSTTYNENGAPAGNIPGEIGNLREQVRILREALTATTQAFTGEEVERAQMQALAALEATKEA